MGPILIFDKSVLEALSPDEAVWLDQFFLCNITPLFFVETLADLEKEARFGNSPQDVVGSLAYKTPDLHSKANLHHQTLLEGELSGQGELDMEYGRPHIGGGRFVELGGQTGAFFEASLEEEALKRWQEHKFLELERSFAKFWRVGLRNIKLEDVYSQYQKSFAGRPKPKTLGEVKEMTDKIISSPDQEQVLIMGLSSLGVSPRFKDEIIARWKKEGCPPIKQFAPYFTHVITVDLLFQIGIGVDLIGRGRPSHRADIAYLYYLPFCMVFSSNDKLHKAVVPLFLRPNQSFISGSDLKDDLGRLDAHYSALPEETKARGLYYFANSPPHDTSFLTTRLWDKHMSSSWREGGGREPQPHSPIGKELQSKLRELEEKAKKEGSTAPTWKGESDQMVIKRMVSGKRGKWNRFPPEVMNRRKNANGEWEDIPTK
ncbi:hypothetical protein A2W48_02245 [Candidatus Giovannonibacteria bacterium RIFCSPHIGHO2_12_44_12]|uniref:Uncharacterized protein n=3 Tax=Candidatus Giovannoniibacteriota TaxID=1752738 RepID=A0A1F5X241_9BACT|nr:MAG: hypothetical protein A2W57_02890 [Candidatus Giovannonibacteria bacterium RIFCSPHIGHO2_02_43_16]OGF81966.1 MAG: hypothetical protein A2W48_02245 [Candidatus Giovannonibacteria bacterium RIFCSPHIGHO2_12_44_12]OGF85528.1 MAG: hypothetical protein A2Z63_03065 [Candidatus Giovannonibacteria bacterium RIFCSPLOWO2_02_44_8]